MVGKTVNAAGILSMHLTVQAKNVNLLVHIPSSIKEEEGQENVLIFLPDCTGYLMLH